jgi:phosphate transport system permease protein
MEGLSGPGRRTSNLVRWADRLAAACITGGGIATIGAVGMVCVFLVWIVLPLLRGATMQDSTVATAPDDAARPLGQELDAHRHLCWHVLSDGRVVVFQLDGGAKLLEQQVFDPANTGSVMQRGSELLLGGSDGSVRFVTVAFQEELVPRGEQDAAMKALAVGACLRVGDSLVESLGQREYRRERPTITALDPVPLASAPIIAADFSHTTTGPMLVALARDGTLYLQSVTTRDDMMLNKQVVTLHGGNIALPTLLGEANRSALPDRVLLTGTGDEVFLAWQDGTLCRIDARDLEAPKLAQTIDLLAGSSAERQTGVHLTALEFLIGKATLCAGDSSGRVRLFFRSPPAEGNGPPRLEFVRELPAAPAAISVFASSERSRLVLYGCADGSAMLAQATSGASIAAVRQPSGKPVMAATIAPKDDAIALADGASVTMWHFDPGHPEVTTAAIFLPVRYEGGSKPEHKWQSSAGSDDYEPKFGLWPLVFGTLKATLYCMILGTPLALLAAIYTSEFLHPRRRAKIKPLIELMASLPSVVLGFLAALIFAPMIEAHLPAVLAMVVVLPMVLLAGAHLWQVAPVRWRPALQRFRLLGVIPMLALSLPLAAAIGDGMQWLLFQGDLRGWLAAETNAVGSPDRGSAFGGWLLLLLPLGALAAAMAMARWTPRFLQTRGAGPLRFTLGALSAVAAAAALACLATLCGLDLRGHPGTDGQLVTGLVGTYVQRNSLVVGLAMGFAVVPIVYTIAEDALSAVPDHLRAASLGAGATPWQTAIRIVLPTALSGIFSALMIGLGRAVGETMIVLMAAGNTPILDLNVFNGFRTLAANIAFELPEAARNSSHYRMLFLAALLLFAMTLVLNTAAELVRQRFRKRAYQL